MNRAKFIFLLLLVLSFFAYNNCTGPLQLQKLLSVNGTEIGNPGPGAQEPSLEPTGTTQIMSYTCALLSKCRTDLTVASCQANFQNVNGVGQALGLPSGSIDPFSELQDAERSGRIIVNRAALDACNQELTNIPCSDPILDMAYNNTTSNPIENSASLYPQNASCPQVLTERTGANQ